MEEVPEMTRAARARMFISGSATAQDIQQHIIEFIDRVPLKAGQVGRVEVTFAHAPDAYIVLWMGEGCQCRGDYDKDISDRDYVVCDPNHMVERRYVVLTNPDFISKEEDEVSNSKLQVSLPTAATSRGWKGWFGAEPTSAPLNRECHLGISRVFEKQRWYYTVHGRVQNWGYIRAPEDMPITPEHAICHAAQAKIDERDERDRTAIDAMVEKAKNAFAPLIAFFSPHS